MTTVIEEQKVSEELAWTDVLEKEISNARNSLRTEKMDISFGELISMYENEELIIDPEFQRLFRWNEEQKTKFIESLLLGIPIPTIFVAEVKETGKWEIVDGLQRVSTVISFFGILKNIPAHQKNGWKLGRGKFITSFDGKSFKELPLKNHINIRRSTCRVEVIKWDSNVDMRYELFNRLNSLGSPLSEQELRNCIFRPHSNRLNQLLKDLSQLPDFLDLVSPTEEQIKQLYLEELVLRFFALYDAVEDTADKIKGATISAYMTSYMQKISEGSYFNYEKNKKLFQQLIELLAKLDRSIFRGRKDGRGPFSASLYDVIMVGVALYFEHYSTSSLENFRKKLAEINNDQDFKKCSSSQANSRSRVTQRIDFARAFFKP